MNLNGMKNSNVWKRILHLALPTPCQTCGKLNHDGDTPWFCSACWAKVALIDGPACTRCGRPFSMDPSIGFSYVCGYCQLNPPFYDGVISAGFYEGPLAKAIQLFKFQKRTRLAIMLSRLMVDSLRKIKKIDFLIPVPLHPARLKEREFNQSFLLSHFLCGFLKKPMEVGYILRTRDTQPQIGLKARDRILNLKGAFTLFKKNKLKDKNILLIDDVFTTGSTVQECCRLLKREGKAHRVFVGTLARARP